jgi:hypothetical protein
MLQSGRAKKVLGCVLTLSCSQGVQRREHVVSGGCAGCKDSPCILPASV